MVTVVRLQNNGYYALSAEHRALKVFGARFYYLEFVQQYCANLYFKHIIHFHGLF